MIAHANAITYISKPAQNIHSSQSQNKTQNTRLQARTTKRAVRVLGYDPEKVLAKEALMEPHRAHLGSADTEEHEIQTLRKTLKDQLRRELLPEVKSGTQTT